MASTSVSGPRCARSIKTAFEAALFQLGSCFLITELEEKWALLKPAESMNSKRIEWRIELTHYSGILSI
jgi:hypothetical protein